MKIKRKDQGGPLVDVSRIVSYCPLCNATFYPHRTSVIGDGERAQLLYASCSHCASAMVLLLLASETGMGTVGLVTDCTEYDIYSFQRTAAIATDDLIDLHTVLEREPEILF